MINPEYLVSATFHISKNYVSNNSFRNPNITLNKITSNISFDNIQGTTTFSSVFLKNGLGALSNYNFDITSQVINCINNSDELLLSINGGNNGYASFYSSNSSSDSLLFPKS